MISLCAGLGYDGRVDSTVLEVQTGAREVVHDLTRECAAFVRGRGDGLLHVFVPHATAEGGYLPVGIRMGG